MSRCKNLLRMFGLGILSVGILCSLGFSQDDFSISLSSGVVADPGQDVAVYFVLNSTDSIAGVEMLLDFDLNLLTFSSVKFLTDFQQVSYDDSDPGRLKLLVKRHHPDSTLLSPLSPGTDTLGVIWFEVTSQDLLIDVSAPVSFIEDPTTPLDDNRLEGRDGNYITPPELILTGGDILIRHPLYGDVNDDEYSYTIADAIFFLNFLAGIQKLNPRQRANSDVNQDGVQASMADFVQLVKVIAEE